MTESEGSTGAAAAPDLRDRRVQVASVREEVYRIVREQILNFAYPPGRRLDLADLEGALGVSRTPVKEALQRLEAEGLVEIRPRRGTFVTAIDEREVRESFELRAVLECGAADIVVERIADTEIAEIEALHGAMSALLDQPDYQAIVLRFIEMDKEFHRRIMESTRHSRLTVHHAQIDTLLHVARVRRRFDRNDSLSTKEEHAAIVDALKTRDEAALRAAIKAHIDGAVRRMRRALPDPAAGGAG